MKIRTALAALATAPLITGHAGAADVISAEPEPMEYVSTCPAYGEGYINIPGTKTCMNLSGYVRSDLKGGDNVYAYKGIKKRDTYAWLARAELVFQTASDTELGTLGTYIEWRSQWDDGDNTLDSQLRAGYIQFAGLRVGMSESIFWYWTGYLGKVLNDDIVDPGMNQRTNVISYTYAMDNGFSAVIGVEQGTDSGSDNRGRNYYLPGSGGRIGPDAGADISDDPAARHFHSGSLIDDYTPNVLVGARYAQGWGSIAATGVYDARHEEWATKLRVNVNIYDGLTLWLMGGYKSDDDYYAYDDIYTARHINKGRNYYYRMHTSQYGDWGGKWAVWGGGSYQFIEAASFNTQLTYDDTSIFTASANVAYTLTPGLTFTPELSYRRYGDKKKWDDNSRVSFDGENAFQGMVRLQRSF